MVYAGETMQDYVDSFEKAFNNLAAMGSPVADDMQVAMFLASFGEKKSSPFGPVIASLQTRLGNLTWETVTSTLMQEYVEQLFRSSRSIEPKPFYQGHALAAGYRPRKGLRSAYNSKNGPEKLRCFECSEVGHLKKKCTRRRQDRTREESTLSMKLRGAAEIATWHIRQDC